MSAYQEGYDAYSDGDGYGSNPYESGTEEAAEWERGYEDSQEDEDDFYRYDDNLSCSCCSCCGCSCDDYEGEDD